MPVARQYVQDNYKDSIGATPDLARFSAAMMFTPFVSVFSHPPDTIKTCLQGDVEQTTYKGYMQTTQVRRAAAATTATAAAAATTTTTAASPPPPPPAAHNKGARDRDAVGGVPVARRPADPLLDALRQDGGDAAADHVPAPLRTGEEEVNVTAAAAPDITASHTVDVAPAPNRAVVST